ncbi:MAG: divergent PAP2 family protein [Gemmatimonadetes bacterium]|nr:MAG: divergent PAP2 family protein [Gemmatimonadota bacterium]
MSIAILFISLSAGWIAQALKVIFYWMNTKRLNFRRLTETGGMPSSHSSTVTALCTLVLLHEGLDSTLFGVTLVFSLIVMYDAAGLRRAVGKQASILNKIVEDMELNRRLPENRLKELLGHTPIEVFMGALLGIAWGLVWYPKI